MRKRGILADGFGRKMSNSQELLELVYKRQTTIISFLFGLFLLAKLTTIAISFSIIAIPLGINCDGQVRRDGIYAIRHYILTICNGRH